MFGWFWRIPVLIYDFFVSNLLTIPAHLRMMQHMTILTGQFLDVGCGTGAPLKKIIINLKQGYDRIVGVDLHEGYSRQAVEMFRNQESVTIHNLDFYELGNLNTVFNFVFFSFSFMLMPDPLKALQVAKRNLQPKGRIGFLMTLNKKVNPFLRKLKPFIKLVTTVDFGNVVLESQFDSVLKEGNLHIIKKVRIQNSFNPLLKIAPVYYVEAEIAE